MHRSTSLDAQQRAEHAMRWYGWGSPVGLGIFAVSLGLAAILWRHATVGGCGTSIRRQTAGKAEAEPALPGQGRTTT